VSAAVDSFRAELETIESAYEFMLAYAAQGRDTDEGAKMSPSIRETLEALLAALPAVGPALAAARPHEAAKDLAEIVAEDAARAATSVRAALACARISSQLVDNLNASIHLRAVLTGLFLADEIVQIGRG
jgi:hypothetical protein